MESTQIKMFVIALIWSLSVVAVSPAEEIHFQSPNTEGFGRGSSLRSFTAEYIKPCRRYDPSLDKCVAAGIQHLAKYLVNGIPELDIPPIEPLVIPRIQIENGVGRIRVKALFSNLTIRGAANHTLTNVRTDILNYKIDLAARVPKVIITGRYEVSGNVLLLNIRSKGDFWASFDEINGNIKLQGGEVFDAERVKFMQIDRVGIDFKIGKARFKIRDRTTNNKILGEAINTFLNENWREVIDEMKYSVASAMGKYFKQLINPALQRIPVNVWLVED